MRLERWAVQYEGPTELVVTDRTPRSMRIVIGCPDSLPAEAELCLVLGNFRSWLEAKDLWQIDVPTVQNGSGRLELLHGVPRDAGAVLTQQHRERQRIIVATARVYAPVSAGARVVWNFTGGPPHHAGLEGVLAVRIRPSEADRFEQIGAAIVLRSVAGPASRLEVRSRPMPASGEQVPTVIFATDALLNPVETYNAQLVFDVPPGIAGLPPIALLAEAQRGRLVLDGVRVPPEGPTRITVRDPVLGIAGSSPAILPGPIKGWRHFFGALHFHTVLSGDGDRNPYAAYAYARDWLNLDVVAVTDHTPRGDRWREIQHLNAEFYVPGHFVTLPAWEWSTTRGHANIYLQSPDISAGPDDRWSAGVHPSQVAWPDGVIVVPHHTNIRSTLVRENGSHFWHEYDWSIPNPRIRLVEIQQTRGNFEADELDPAWRIVTGGIGASVRDALGMGYRIGFVGGTDNHSGYPVRDPEPLGRYGGLTGFLARDLTREEIWQAMQHRRTYATSGAPIVCYFDINDAVMGSEQVWRADEGVHFSAKVYGTAPIEVVEVVSNGAPVWQATPNACDIELAEEVLPSPSGNSTYYYLRLRQADGYMAWTSPVWLDPRTT